MFKALFFTLAFNSRTKTFKMIYVHIHIGGSHMKGVTEISESNGSKNKCPFILYHIFDFQLLIIETQRKILPALTLVEYRPSILCIQLQ